MILLSTLYLGIAVVLSGMVPHNGAPLPLDLSSLLGLGSTWWRVLEHENMRHLWRPVLNPAASASGNNSLEDHIIPRRNGY